MADPGAATLSVNRIEALVDGIFAVAMTILVLEIHLPEPTAGQALARRLLALSPKLGSYAVGFVVLGTMWVGHHYQFHFIRRVDRPLLWINLLFLLAISFLPFCVALLGNYHDDPLAVALYGAAVEVAGGCLLGQWLYATRRGRLVGRDLAPGVVRALRGRTLIGMIGYGAGVVLAFAAPRAALACYAAMPLIYLLPGRIDRHVKQKEDHAGTGSGGPHRRSRATR
jgi:uncharacterized membrane protein